MLPDREIINLKFFHIRVLIILVICWSIFPGCRLIAKLGHGTNKPKIENQASVIKWLNKKGFTQAAYATVSPDNFDFFVPRFLSSIFLFDRSGRFLAVGYHQG